MTTIDIIKKLLSERKWKISELSKKLGLSRQIIHRHIKKLLENDDIQKIGSPSMVYYQIQQRKKFGTILNNGTQKIIQENFLLIDADGLRYDGVEAFSYWCEKRGFDVHIKSKEYVDIHKKYQKFAKNGVINAGFKLKELFKKRS